jgi:hypothetical protein
MCSRQWLRRVGFESYFASAMLVVKLIRARCCASSSPAVSPAVSLLGVSGGAPDASPRVPIGMGPCPCGPAASHTPYFRVRAVVASMLRVSAAEMEL